MCYGAKFGRFSRSNGMSVRKGSQEILGAVRPALRARDRDVAKSLKHVSHPHSGGSTGGGASVAIKTPI